MYYRRYELQWRMSLFFSASIIAGAFGGVGITFFPLDARSRQRYFSSSLHLQLRIWMARVVFPAGDGAFTPFLQASGG
jgi:hypothetical protein